MDSSVTRLSNLPPDIIEGILGHLKDAGSIFRLYWASDARLRSLLTHLTKEIYFHYVMGRPPRSMVEMLARFPNLTWLKIDVGHPPQHFSKCHLQPEFIQTLSRRIEFLEFPCTSTEYGVLKSFPAGLRSLVLPHDRTIDYNAVHSLPPNLTLLSCGALRQVHENVIYGLPRTITSLALGDNSLPDASMQWLPPSLTALMLDNNRTLTDKAIEFLPRTLRELRLNQNRNLTDYCLTSLPEGLTALRISSSSITLPGLTPFLPRFKELLLPPEVVSAFRDTHARMLSPEMISINLGSASDLTEEIASTLPVALDREANLVHLPLAVQRGLAKLFVKSCSDRSRKPFYSYYASSIAESDSTLITSSIEFPMLKADFPEWVLPFLDDHIIEFLPRCIVHLDWAHPALTDVGIKSLPPNLTVLRLASTVNLTNACIPFLPRTLVELSLPKCSKFTDAGMEHIPPSLTILDLRNNRSITDAALRLLPQSTLTDLNLLTNGHITDAGIKHLPRGLIRFDLSWNRRLTDKAIPDLPPALTDLRLDSCALLTDACCSQFPKTLTSLYIRDATKITSTGRAQLKYLQYCSLPNF